MYFLKYKLSHYLQLSQKSMAGGKIWRHFKPTKSKKKKEEVGCTIIQILQILQLHANQLLSPTVQNVCDLTT